MGGPPSRMPPTFGRGGARRAGRGRVSGGRDGRRGKGWPCAPEEGRLARIVRPRPAVVGRPMGKCPRPADVIGPPMGQRPCPDKVVVPSIGQPHRSRGHRSARQLGFCYQDKVLLTCSGDNVHARPRFLSHQWANKAPAGPPDPARTHKKAPRRSRRGAPSPICRSGISGRPRARGRGTPAAAGQKPAGKNRPAGVQQARTHKKAPRCSRRGASNPTCRSREPWASPPLQTSCLGSHHSHKHGDEARPGRGTFHASSARAGGALMAPPCEQDCLSREGPPAGPFV